jgi:hypothetical protein
MVTEAYKEPNAVLDIFMDSTQKGTNKDMKNVCPKEEKKLNKKPKLSTRLLLNKNPNQFFIVISKDRFPIWKRRQN